MWYVFLVFIVVAPIALIVVFFLTGKSILSELRSYPLRPVLNEYAYKLADSYNEAFDAGREADWSPYGDSDLNLWWTSYVATLSKAGSKVAVQYADYLYAHFDDAARRNLYAHKTGKPFKNLLEW